MADSASYVGRTVAGKYRLVAPLGEGAMASVYRATRDEEPQEIAVKIMHQELRELPSFSRRFRREAKAASKLRHPNTAKIYEYGDDEEFAYIAMEILIGRDLFDVMKAEKRLDPSRAVHLMKQICQAVAEAQHHGIVHRDLKAENVMLVPDENDFWGERVKVLDFGIAKIIEPEKGKIEDMATNLSGSALTQVGSVLGTPEYMAPEQCKAEKVDFRTDVYAAGVLLYLMVTGRLPFTGELPATVMLKHVREKPESPSKTSPEIGAQMEAVILKALEKDPADRFQHANEMYWALTEIEQWMDEETIAAPSTDEPKTMGEAAAAVPLPVVPPGGLPSPSAPPPTSATPNAHAIDPMRQSIPPLAPHPEGPSSELFGSSPFYAPPPSAHLPPVKPPAPRPDTVVMGPLDHPLPASPPRAPSPVVPSGAPPKQNQLLLVFVGTLVAVGALTTIVLLLVL